VSSFAGKVFPQENGALSFIESSGTLLSLVGNGNYESVCRRRNSEFDVFLINSSSQKWVSSSKEGLKQLLI